MRITSSILKSLVLTLLVFTACKQETIQGIKATEAVKVYFPDAEKPNGLIEAISKTNMVVDTVAETVNFPVPVYRGGFYNLEQFTVDASVDNSAIDALILSGDLPANTVILTPGTYSITQKDTVKKSSDILKGTITTRVKKSSLIDYAGKTVALGLKISNPSMYEVNEDLSKVIIYFNVDDLLDRITPKDNMIDKANWVNLRINNDENVKFEINPNGKILATGGNWGHAGVYQAVEVRANKSYKVDMKVKGSGATDVWFEVYVSKKEPTQGSDYSENGTRIGLNTWNGCGNTSFDDLLSKIKCAGSSNVVTFPTAGTVYIVIKSGGGNLGTTGITMSAVDFRRID
ncbi:hypothetical protein [Pedobacter alpinus]|uniref:DUF1735 domain-containing protein n=1 Tax=Pedobacter alpinus TaxID=1590643 RepID=A0ABW5TVF5_9SPHI